MHVFCIGLLEQHFYKTFVNISAMIKACFHTSQSCGSSPLRLHQRPGLFLQFCLVISGQCLDITQNYHSLSRLASVYELQTLILICYSSGGWSNFSCYKKNTNKIYHSIYEILGWRKYHEHCNLKKYIYLAQKKKIIGEGT